MKKEPVTQAPNMLCRYCQPAHSFMRRDQKLVRRAEPSLSDTETDRVLHPCICDDDEIAR